MKGYTLVLASDILDRDGMGLELYDPAGTRVAEIFQDDESGERTVAVFTDAPIDDDVLTWYRSRADAML